MSATAALSVPIDDADERAVTKRGWNGGLWFRRTGWRHQAFWTCGRETGPMALSQGALRQVSPSASCPGVTLP